MIFSKVEKLTYDLAYNVVTEEGYDIYDVEYVKEGPHWFLRVFIDKEDGVNVNDCETISRKLSTLLDEKDFVQTNYFLEVSSPGIERNLRQEEHFEKVVGSLVKLKLYRPIDGAKEIEGELLDAQSKSITIDVGGTQHVIEKKDISKANVKFEF